MTFQLWPYQVENTSSHSNTAIKQPWAWLVIRWVTAWEPRVLLAWNIILYFLHLVLFSLCEFLLTVFVLCVLSSSYVYLLYLMCICCTLCVFVVPYVYLLYYVCIAVLTLDAGLLARSQYPEGPMTGHLDTGFFGFPVSTSECWDGSLVSSCYYMPLK